MAYKVDTPMECCGLMEAHSFPPYSASRLHEEFREVKAEAKYNQRACLLITLSSEQPTQKQIAEEEGFKVIHEFYNPRSQNRCYIMACDQEF